MSTPPRIPVSTLAALLKLASKGDGQDHWQMVERLPIYGSYNMLAPFGEEPVTYQGMPLITVDRRDLCAASLEYVEALIEARHEAKQAKDRARRMGTVLSAIERHFRTMGFIDHPCLTDEDREFIRTGIDPRTAAPEGGGT